MKLIREIPLDEVKNLDIPLESYGFTVIISQDTLKIYKEG